MEEKLRKQEFTLDDLLEQLRTIRKMGSLGGLMKMIPGLGKQLRDVPVDDRQLDRVEAIILSMTPEERRAPEIVNGTRRARIARGSGTSVQQINALLQQHRQMKKMMKTLAGGKMPGVPGLPGMPGARAGCVKEEEEEEVARRAQDPPYTGRLQEEPDLSGCRGRFAVAA